MNLKDEDYNKSVKYISQNYNVSRYIARKSLISLNIKLKNWDRVPYDILATFFNSIDKDYFLMRHFQHFNIIPEGD